MLENTLTKDSGEGTVNITMDKKGNKYINKVDVIKESPLEENEKHIIIIGADGEKHIKIKGDAVISIKEGKVHVEGGEEVEIEEKVIKEGVEKTEVKKVKKEKKEKN